MRALVQRVQRGHVSVEGQIVGQIGRGFVLLLGITHRDGSPQLTKLAEKVVHLRVFEDEHGKMNRSLLDIGGEILLISQFTLYAETKKGRRPSFTQAAPPEIAAPLVVQFGDTLHRLGIARVQTGIFGATMQVHIENDGPVTIMLDTVEWGL